MWSISNTPFWLMTNLFVAYTLPFIIFIFVWLLISRQTRLEKKLDELKERLKEVNH
jgi:hypothetical protein